jgi:hypothetical protein
MTDADLQNKGVAAQGARTKVCCAGMVVSQSSECISAGQFKSITPRLTTHMQPQDAQPSIHVLQDPHVDIIRSGNPRASASATTSSLAVRGRRMACASCGCM